MILLVALTGAGLFVVAVTKILDIRLIARHPRARAEAEPSNPMSSNRSKVTASSRLIVALVVVGVLIAVAVVVFIGWIQSTIEQALT